MTGIWRGKLTQDSGGCYREYFIELQIQHTADGITGYSYDYYDPAKYVKLNFTGRFNVATKRIVIIENKVLDFKIPRDCIPCIKIYDLHLASENNEDVLTGTWQGLPLSGNSNCPPGRIFLKRENKSAFQKEKTVKGDTLAAIEKRLSLQPRKIDLVQTLILDTSRIKIELYDNGEVDGDTVTIFLNGQLLLYQKRLTEKPLTMEIPITAGKDYEMVMYADNLGSIPPNTALMVVTAGKIKHEVYLSSSEQKSAAVKFRYEIKADHR